MNEVRTTTPMKQADILRNAAEFILNSFNKHQDTRLVFHNYAYTQSLVRCVQELGSETLAAEEEMEAAQLAAWFLYAGYLFDYQNYTKYSLDQLQRFLILQEYPESSQNKVLRCLQTVAEKRDCHTLSEKILADAVIINFIDNFEEKSPLLRLEHEFILHRSFSKQEWAQQQLQTLLGLNLQTSYAKSKYEPHLAQAIRIQKLILEKAARNAEPTLQSAAGAGLYQNLDESPIRAVQTFFRANYRNHINLSAIADNKANIMISVNSILISVLISVLSYRNMAETHPDIVLPVVIFLVSGLASLIFAVLSARPKVTALNNEKTPKEQIQRNIVFFGNFVPLQLEEYETAMDAMFRDSELMYGNMTRDLYYLGKVLEKKYRYLTVSYNIFMVGFIATVGMFLFTFFT